MDRRNDPGTHYEFFQSYIKHVYDKNKEMVFENDDAYIRFMLDELCKNHKACEITIPESRKSNIISYQLRLDAVNKKSDEAFNLLTKSIAYAPVDSKELALAFNQRSKITFKAKLYSDCLKDIDNSLLTHNCPDYVKSELYLRKATCYQITTKDQSLIKNTFLDSRKFVKNMKAQSGDLMEHKIALQENKTIFDTTYYKVTHNEDPSMVDLRNENPDIPGASDAITIKYDENYGRHIVATRDIEPGETLLVQKPYAAVLYLSKRFNYCWYCCKQTWSSIPCEKCTKVMFCSPDCRGKANKEFHDYECPIIQTFFFVNDIHYSCLFDLRLFMKGFRESNSSLYKLKRIFDKVEQEPESLERGCTDGKFLFSHIQNILSLPVNKLMNKTRSNFLLGNNILIAYYLAKKTNLIDKKIKVTDTLVEIKDKANFSFIINILSKLSKISEANIYYASKYVEIGGPEQTFRSIEPLFHLFKHSCTPDVTRIFHGNNVVAKSVTPIKKDEKIYESYVTPYYLLNRNGRHEKLNERFDMTCDCEACVNDWPTPGFDYPPPYGDFNKFQEMSVLLETTRKNTKDIVKFTFDHSFFQYQQDMDLKNNDKILLSVSQISLTLNNTITDAIELVKYFFKTCPKNSMETYKAVLCLNKLLYIKQNKKQLLLHPLENELFF